MEAACLQSLPSLCRSRSLGIDPWEKEKTKKHSIFFDLLDFQVSRHMPLIRRKRSSLLKVLGRISLARRFHMVNIFRINGFMRRGSLSNLDYFLEYCPSLFRVP